MTINLDMRSETTPKLNPEKNWSWFGGSGNLERLRVMDTAIRIVDVDIGPVDCVRDLDVMLTAYLACATHRQSDFDMFS